MKYAAVVFVTNNHIFGPFILLWGVHLIFPLFHLGNALVCIVIIKRKDMRTVTNLFLFNMALSDLLSTVLFVPGLLALEISPYYWPLGEFMCLATRVISTILLAVSIFSMTVLAVERYMHHLICNFIEKCFSKHGLTSLRLASNLLFKSQGGRIIEQLRRLPKLQE